MSDDKNLYEILEIPVGSKETMIKRAYRRLSFKYHPDTQERGLSEETKREYELELLKVQEAYETLSNPELKEAYDSIVTVLEEQETVSWEDPYDTGPWNIPTGIPPRPYYPFSSGSVGAQTSGSAYSIYTGWWSPTSSSSYFSPSFKTTFNIHVDDVVAAGLIGLVAGQIVNVVYGFTGIPSISMNTQPAGLSNISCKIISAHYGTAPGLPVYGDFELEEL